MNTDNHTGIIHPAPPGRPRHNGGDMPAETEHIARLGSWECMLAERRCRLSPTAREITGLAGNTDTHGFDDLAKLVHPDDFAAIHGVCQHALNARTQIDLTIRIRRPDGAIRHVHVRAEPLYNDDGRPHLLVGTLQDISAIKTIERDLSLFRALVENAGQGFCVTTPSGTITYLNTACCMILEAGGPEQCRGKRIRSLFPPQVRKRVHTGIIAPVRSGGSWSGELPLLSSRGRTIPIYATVAPITGGSGRVEFIAWAFTDITKVKTSAAELHTANEFLSNIVNAISDPVIVRDDTLTFVLLNNAAAELLGHPRRDIIGATSLDFLPPETRTRVDEADRTVIETGETMVTELVSDGQDGLRTLLEKKSRFVDPEFGQRFTITAVRDITDIKRIELELTRYRDQLEELVERRTTELLEVNRQLKQEIEERQKVEKRLRRSEDSLAEKALTLQDANTALKVLIEYQDGEKQRLGDNVRHSMRSLIAPYLEKLRTGMTDENQLTLLNIIETNLSEITRPFSKNLLNGAAHLSMTEVQVAKLTSDGRTAKEIADIVAISENTVKVHKRNIRNKLGIKGSPVNLRTHLQQLFDDDTLSMTIHGIRE